MVAITSILISDLIKLAAGSAIRFAKSPTVIFSGTVTSLDCFLISVVWLNCFLCSCCLCFARARFTAANERTRCSSLSKTLEIVNLPSRLFFSPFCPLIFFSVAAFFIGYFFDARGAFSIPASLL